jgi:mono/diheme cytochrome c family protein
MTYKALPLAVLLHGFTLPQSDGLQAVATDGFTAGLPAALALGEAGNEGAVAYLAIEPPDHPWPKLDGKQQSAGPFYVVWLRPATDDIRPEQWPYGVVKISSAPSPQKRWPAMAVDAALPADAPELKGLALFATNCMVCHKINGAGDAEVGPDLNLPESPVEYFQPKALHRYIRDPASLRAWKTMGMKGFSAEALSDDEIDLIIAYLKYMSEHKQPLK